MIECPQVGHLFIFENFFKIQFLSKTESILDIQVAF